MTERKLPKQDGYVRGQGLLTREFLRRGGSINDLAERYAIKTVRSQQCPSLVLFKYDQLASPMSEPIVRECRGLILDEADNWQIVSRSFDKFFNHNEGRAAPIDWSTARVQEKVDGSLCVMYRYRDIWRVQTSGHPDAAGPVNDTGTTFETLFWKTFLEEGYAMPNLHGSLVLESARAKDLCLIFELTSKWNRIVVQHAEAHLTLIGIRDRYSGAEYSPEILSHLYKTVRQFPFDNLDSVIDTFKQIDPLRQEGYVVVDGTFNRIKVKHPGYVAIHHLRGSYSTRRLVEIVQAGEVGEFASYFPEWRAEFEQVMNGMAELERALWFDYERLRDISEQKAFALEAVKTRCSAALFAVRAGKAKSIREFLHRQKPETIMQLLGLKEKHSEPVAE